MLNEAWFYEKDTGHSDGSAKLPPGLKPQKIAFEELLVEVSCSHCGGTSKLLELKADYGITESQLLGYASCLCGRSVFLIVFEEGRFEAHLRCDIDSHYYIQAFTAGISDFQRTKSHCPICHRTMEVLIRRPSAEEARKRKEKQADFIVMCDMLLEIVGIRCDMTLESLCTVLEHVLGCIDLGTNAGGLYLFEDSLRLHFNGPFDEVALQEYLGGNDLLAQCSNAYLSKYEEPFELLGPECQLEFVFSEDNDLDLSVMLAQAMTDLFSKGVSQIGFQKNDRLMHYYVDTQLDLSKIRSGYTLQDTYLTTSLREFIGAHVRNYQIVHHVGSGVSANVFKAQAENKTTVVALKVYRPWIFDKFREQDIRFEREFNLMSRIDVDGIVKVLDKGVISIAKKLRHFIIMDFIDGLTLHTWRTQFGSINQQDFLMLMISIAQSLQYLHEQGICHRDLKPENIMIRHNDRTPIIMDFGVMKVLNHRITDSGQFLGTKLYSPPEYIEGESDIDWHAVDIYCLGGIAWFLLNGKAPWKLIGNDVKELIRKKQKPVTLSLSHVSSTIIKLIEQMLSIIPTDRPSLETSINTFRSALQYIKQE
ncbi:MAG TPA: serine/threonine-protein kinase [Thermoguttaceae bacterium]|nr:serine/threonine-protein kinase [Thermoguttaceae bacterium]